MRLQVKAHHERLPESVRVYAEKRLGKLDKRLHDLTLVEQDVMQPWSANHTVTIAGRFAARGSSVRSFNVATPLDGAFTASVQGSPVLRLDVFSGKKRLVRGTRSTAGTVCGPRTLTFRVTRTAGSGAFKLAVSLP